MELRGLAMRSTVWWVSLAVFVLASASGCEYWLDRREDRQERYCREHYPYGAYGQQCCPPPANACPPDGYHPGYYQPTSSFIPPAYSGCR